MLPPLTFEHHIAPLLASILIGGLIGFEREFHGRPAGLRTHVLVSLAAAVLMVAASEQAYWLRDTPASMIRIDPARMAHGILTGIGFLCGGVIFRQGLSVHGLTTAASLWTVSALGTVCGMRLYGLALVVALVALAVLTLLRVLEEQIAHYRLLDVAVRFRSEEAVTPDEFRGLAREAGLSCGPVRHRLMEQGRLVEIAGVLQGRKRTHSEDLAATLRGDARVVEFDITPRNE